MKTQKMSLANIQGKLSREEMKKIMAGSGDCCLSEYSWDCSRAKPCCTGLNCVRNGTNTGTICMSY